jgi:hypothetical protein
MNELSDDQTTPPGPGGPAPGSPGALSAGCRCSVLLNQAVGQGPDDDGPGFVNPLCPVHGSLGSESGPEPDLDRPVRS